MPASVVARKPKTIVLQIEVPIEPGNMLDLEDGLQRVLNEAGLLGTKELLQLFEPPNKDPIVVNQQKWSYKGKELKKIGHPFSQPRYLWVSYSSPILLFDPSFSLNGYHPMKIPSKYMAGRELGRMMQTVVLKYRLPECQTVVC